MKESIIFILLFTLGFKIIAHDLRSAPRMLFLANHLGAGLHFEQFARVFDQHNIQYQFLASDLVYKKLNLKNIVNTQTILEENLLNEISLLATQSSAILVDVGSSFSEKVLNHLKVNFPKVKRLAYHDNPEVFVPGGYSAQAEKTMLLADQVLFSNRHHATGEHPHAGPANRIGIGYYPLDDVKILIEKRKTKANTSAGQKLKAIIVGGANADYFSAFELFLQTLKEAAKVQSLNHITLYFQQHPAAKTNYQDRDRHFLQEWVKTRTEQDIEVVFSTVSTQEALLFADFIFYHQTSDSPKFVLAGIPAIQVGLPYQDLMVKNGFVPSALNSQEMLAAINKAAYNPSYPQEKILEAIGYSPRWRENILQLVKEL